jgi:hypothetical protein
MLCPKGDTGLAVSDLNDPADIVLVRGMVSQITGRHDRQVIGMAVYCSDYSQSRTRCSFVYRRHRLGAYLDGLRSRHIHLRIHKLLHFDVLTATLLTYEIGDLFVGGVTRELVVTSSGALSPATPPQIDLWFQER